MCPKMPITVPSAAPCVCYLVASSWWNLAENLLSQSSGPCLPCMGAWPRVGVGMAWGMVWAWLRQSCGVGMTEGGYGHGHGYGCVEGVGML